MAQIGLAAEYLRLRDKSTGALNAGQTVALLPNGGTAPDDLVSLSENAGLGGQYDFPAGVTNGLYDVYINGNPLMNNGDQVQVRVYRNGIVSATDTDFGKDEGSWSP